MPAHAAEPSAAHFSATSRSGASMIQKPPRYSFDSANGPSVTRFWPVVLSTQVADVDRQETAGEHPRAGVADLRVESVDVVVDLLQLGGVGRGIVLAHDAVDGEHVLRHRDSSSVTDPLTGPFTSATNEPWPVRQVQATGTRQAGTNIHIVWA